MSKAGDDGKVSPFHKCTLSFTTKYYNDAYPGDALHKLHVRRVLLNMGYTYSDSCVQESKYVSNEAQAAYLATTHHYTVPMHVLSAHKKGTVFEELYNNNEDFRKQYLYTTFNDPTLHN